RYIARYSKGRCSARYIFNFGKYFNLLAISRVISLPFVPAKAGTQGRGSRLGIPGLASSPGTRSRGFPLEFAPAKAGREGTERRARRRYGCAAAFSTNALV